VDAVKEALARDAFATPWGWVAVLRSARGVRRVVLPRRGRRDALAALAAPRGTPLRPWPEFRAAVLAYLAGRAPAPDFPLDLPRLGPFARQALAAARAVPAGGTVTYGELAAAAGRPGAARAAGGAMARNPVPLLVPCHRVVPAAGGVGGFAGGASLKARLLALEARCGR